MKNSYKVIFGIILAIFFLLLWFRLIDWDRSVLFLSQINLILLLPVFLIMVFNSFLASYRLKVLMEPIGKASVFYFWGLAFIGGITSFLIPFQGGGFLRAYLVKKRFQKPFSTCFAIVFFDFLLGVGVLVVFSLLAIAFFTFRETVLNSALWLAGFFLLALVILIQRNKKLKKLSWWKDFRLGFSLLSGNWSLLIFAFTITLLIFSLSGLKMYLLFYAFKTKISFLAVLLAGAIFGLSSLLPGAPIRIGQYEVLGLLVYTLLLGLDKNLVAAAVLLSHFLSVSFTFLGGFIASVVLGIKPGKIKGNR